MSRLFIFADEAGCMEFSRKQNVSRYFIAATVAMESCDVGDALTGLRRELAWSKHELGEYFHCSKDKQAIRDEVYKLICGFKFTVQATIFEKCKAHPKTRADKATFYKHAWYYHFKHMAKKTVGDSTELMVVTAAFGQRNERVVFDAAVLDVLRQTLPAVKYEANFCPAAADPCLSVVDYCAWAIQRKWESDGKDVRSFDIIKDRITHEADSWSHGKTNFY
jgi:Protein of unknown function (DUF3800)